MNNIHRDSQSGALVNYDKEGYEQAKARKRVQQRRRQLEQENAALRTRVDILEQRVDVLEEALIDLLKWLKTR